MRLRFFYCSVMISGVVFAMAGQLPAQQAAGTGASSVSGHVICADTNAPARFAKILLKSTVPNEMGQDFIKSLQENLQKQAAKSGDATPPKPMTDEQKRAMAAAAKGMNQATDMLSASTVGMDGSFSFSGVKPGTYYVHALYAGYVDPFSQLSDEDLTSSDPAVKARVAQIPTITVTGTDAARIDLRLERGGAVSGRILFDDGSPAVGWMLAAIHPKSTEDVADATSAMMTQALAMSGGAQIFKTDDLGRYRISGLPAGDYAVRGTLIAQAVGISGSNLTENGSGISLTVYTGDTFSRAGAKTLHVTAGEELPGVDITVPAHTLHDLVGHVYAKGDGHALNMGSVSLTNKDDPGVHAKAAIRDDGSFRFEYLPRGTYTLSVQDGADAKKGASSASFLGITVPNQDVLRKYGSATADVSLSDADVDTVKLTVAQTDWVPPVKKGGGAGQKDMFNGLLGGDGGDTSR